ncbi:MAG: hypothetical protein ACE5KZ_12040 [Candidatus Scalinduaceae bacterium]
MIHEKKGAAYYGKKYSIKNIHAGNTVCLYHVGAGVIGIGQAKTDFLKKDVNGESDEEYYIPIDFEYLVDIKQSNWHEMAIHAWEINDYFNTSYRFRQTVFQLPYEFADYIKKKFNEKSLTRGN